MKRMNLEDFKRIVSQMDEADEGDLDSLCCRWLKEQCPDYGRDGHIAEVLLGEVKVLLEIY